MFRFSPRTNRAREVKWRPWGEAAFREAHQQDKLVVVCLTAFWCGYCQQMDETSLSNDNVQALLNAFFIPIRVEESQRPDVDVRYNQDGWPTIAFLTPSGDPLFSVNYTAPEPFINLLVKVVDSHQRDKVALYASAQQNRAEALVRQSTAPPARLAPEIVSEIVGMVEGLSDTTHGGYGTQFKFLHSEANAFRLYLYELTGDVSHLQHVTFTLDKMHQSRTFDDQHGGFFRYSSKPDWQEPHPEKLLDDQAAMVQTYLRSYVLTDDDSHRKIAEGLLSYIESTLSKDNWACFSGCQDYVRPEVDLSVPRDGPPALISLIDDYIYCDANARTASAYLDAWWVLGRDAYKDRGCGILDDLWKSLRAPDGGMYHYSDGEPHVPGLLMDAVVMGQALLDAYRRCDDAIYLDRAKLLADDIVRLHRNSAGGFNDISELGPANLQTALPILTQNATTAAFFVSLADLSKNLEYRKLAYWALKRFPNSHRDQEAFAAGFGHALSRLLAQPLYVILRGAPGDPGLRALMHAALTQLKHGDLVLQFRSASDLASATINIGNRTFGPFTDPAALSPELLQVS